MRRLERGLILFATAMVIGLLAMAVRGSSRGAERAALLAREAADRAAGDSAFADSVLAAAGPQNVETTLRPSDEAAPERDPTRIAWLLETRTSGTYMHELLAAHDSQNFRWPDRRTAPMRVWVQTAPNGTPGWDASYPQLVRDAFVAWADAGVPIHFTFVTDSARGEILVTWTDRFEAEMTGRTRWAHDQHRWIVGGSLLLALHLPDGRPLGGDAVRAIALHEVGHLIGLDHTHDDASIMAPRIRVHELSEADRLTARLVYSLPPGSLKALPRP